jgi:hypothetical protein
MMRVFVPDVTLESQVGIYVAKGGTMWWGIGIGGGILYLIVAFTLGLMTLRNGHGWMFFFGIFFPVLWIFGAFMRGPDRTQPA